jgi:hypothetical protein
MPDEPVDLRRVEQIMLLTSHGLDPGPTTFAERIVATRFIQEMVQNWQRAGVIPQTREPLDLRAEDVAYIYRRWAHLEALRLDPVVGWRPRQTLRGLLRTAAADRLPYIRAAPRLAGIDVPTDEWALPGD